MDAIADAAHSAMDERERSLRLEQAVHGLDALEELALHPLLAEGVGRAGWGVLREQVYPHEWRRKLVSEKSGVGSGASVSTLSDRDRMRCDLVLTEHAGQRLVDELTCLRANDRSLRAASGSLFADIAEREARVELEAASIAGTSPEDAFWLEIKVVRQFDLSSGAPGFNRGYASELVGSVSRDLKKLSGDGRIHHAGVLLLLFTQDRGVAEHDLGVMLHSVMNRGAPVRSATVRWLEITDRLGNAVCGLCLIGAGRAE